MINWPWLRKNKSVVETPVMTSEDKAVIFRFAAGDKTCRDMAIDIHRRYIPTLGCHGNVEQNFMAEVDNPCPDYGLRNHYRAHILAQNS